jgi:hypothetical protein
MSWRAKISLVVLAIASLAVAAVLWRQAFPLANLQFRVSRAEAQTQLAAFVESLGCPLDGYRAAAGFGEDTDAKNYLDIAKWATLPLAVGAVMMLIIALRRHQFRGRHAAPWHWMALFAAVGLAYVASFYVIVRC